MPNPPKSEDALIARLNALRRSHMNEAASSTPTATPTTPPPQPKTPKTPTSTTAATAASKVDSDLAARFRNLTPTPTSTPSKPVIDVQKYAELDNGGVGDTVHNEEDELDLEELLAQLDAKDEGEEGGWRLNPDEPRDVQKLLREAKEALPKDGEGDGEVSEEVEGYREGIRDALGELKEGLNGQDGASKEEGPEEREGSQADAVEEEEEVKDLRTEKEREEEEADEYIQQVLAQIDVEGKYDKDGGDRANNSDDGGGDEANELSLPSAPTALPPPPTTATEPHTSSIDDLLASRFASLGLAKPDSSSEDPLGLPSAPSFAPSKKPVTITKSLPSKKSNLEKYTDEDIDSWCCICNEDATVRCLGCDSDLYCAACWRDGHGDLPGQERGHRALAYTRGKGEAAAA